jgi:hypothetical protein
MEDLVPDSNKTMITITNEPNDTHRKFLREEIIDKVTEKLMEKITRHG